LFQWFYLGLTDLNLKGISVNDVQEETKSASVSNLYFLSNFQRNKKMYEDLSSFLLYNPGLSKLSLTDCLCLGVGGL